MLRKYFVIFFVNIFLPLAIFAQDSLTWGDCLKYAQESNPDLISARESIKQAQADRGIARGALMPSLGATLNYSRSESGGLKSGNITDRHGYALNAEQIIFDGMKTINNHKASKENIQYKTCEYDFASAKIRLNLRSAYIALLKAQNMIDTAKDITALRREEASLIELRYLSGLEHKGAMLRAQANLAQGVAELSQAERNLRFCQRQLAVRIGWGEFSALKVAGDLAVSDADISMPDFDLLVKSNPQYLAAIAKRNIVEYDLKAAYGDLSPEVKASANLGKSSSTWPPQDGSWGVGLSLQMPIFEGGSNKAKVDKASSLRDQALADISSTYNSLVMGLEQAWAAMCDAYEAVGVKEKELLAAQERYQIGKAQYSNGFIDFDNWIIIEDDLVNAKKAYLDARANALYAQANWIYAKGGVIEYAD